MRQVILTSFITLCCLGPLVIAGGQTSPPDRSEVFKQLLALPAPTPRNAGTPEPLEQLPSGFFDRHNPPPDDAPAKELVLYWSRWSYATPSFSPSPVVKQRLLDACVDSPSLLAAFLNVLPDSEATAAKVKELYEAGLSNENLDENWRATVKEWLIFNSAYFLSELHARANKAKDNDESGNVDELGALLALAKYDWSSAEPLLRNLNASGQPRSAAMALAVFYRHSVDAQDAAAEERYRRTLKTIAENSRQPGDARDTAIGALSRSEWADRDEWYLSLFQDETLIQVDDGSNVYSPLCTVIDSDPEKWIPVFARQAESKNVVVRSVAASCLAKFENEKDTARKDALRPLLPWLSNPGWAIDRGENRLRLIQGLAKVDLPESVPGLIWAIEHDNSDDGYNRSYAAQALAVYKDPRAAPALKKTLAREKSTDNRKRIISGLLACQGLPDEEQVEALEAYASGINGPEQVVNLNGESPLSVPASIGEYLSQLTDVPDSLAQAALRRVETLKETNPALATAVLEIVNRWQSRQVDLDMIRRIGNGSADSNTITAALNRREKLHQNLRPEIEGLLAVDGPPQGIGAVLLDEPSLAHGVLSSRDQMAKIALLTCARLMQTPLPMELVGPLLHSKNSLLSLAAERYLLAEDSREAHELLWQRHPNEGFVAGWRENIYTLPLDDLVKAEEKLRAELFKEGGPVEIFAWLSTDEHYARMLRIYADRAVYTSHEDPARYRERVITKVELASFRESVRASGFEDLPPQFGWCHHGCGVGELVTLTRGQGRRVFIYKPLGELVGFNEQLNLLGEGEDIRTHYQLEEEIKGLEILYADNNLIVRDVWQRGNETRIFLERQMTEEDYKERDQSYRADEDEDEFARAERRRLRAERDKARFSWRLLTNNKAGAMTSQPEGYSTLDDSKFPLTEDDESYNGSMAQIVGDALFIARGSGGLWKQLPGSTAVRISGETGEYSNPVATPDGKWVVLAKADDSWSEPNYVVRFNVRTGREFRVNLEPADDFKPVIFLPVQNKVLLRRARNTEQTSSAKPVGPERPEYYLLDVATGETRLVKGEFSPLSDVRSGERFLQATDKPNEFWVAIPNPGKDQTQVGRYNLKDFSFKPALVVPHISFDSLSMWVDGNQQKLYIVYQGQLLRLPLQPPPQ